MSKKPSPGRRVGAGHGLVEQGVAGLPSWYWWKYSSELSP